MATPNAGAFLSPSRGVLPVPSSFIDQRGASVEHVAESELERRGRREARAPAARRPRPAGATWLRALGLSLAIWSLCYAVLVLVLDTTAWAGDGPTVALAAALLLAAWLGSTQLTARGMWRVAILAALTLAGALVTAWTVSGVGGPALVIVILAALAGLSSVHLTRPL